MPDVQHRIRGTATTSGSSSARSPTARCSSYARNHRIYERASVKKATVFCFLGMAVTALAGTGGGPSGLEVSFGAVFGGSPLDHDRTRGEHLRATWSLVPQVGSRSRMLPRQCGCQLPSGSAASQRVGAMILCGNKFHTGRGSPHRYPPDVQDLTTRKV